MAKNVENWTASDVGDWLKTVDLAAYVDLFETNVVDGKILLTMTENDVKTPPLAIPKFGDIRRFGLAVEELRLEIEEPTNAELVKHNLKSNKTSMEKTQKVNPRKRGRPKSSHVSPERGENEIIATNHQSPVKSPKKPRGRGRPKNSAAVQPAEKNDLVSSPRRGRGRPKNSLMVSRNMFSPLKKLKRNDKKPADYYKNLSRRGLPSPSSSPGKKEGKSAALFQQTETKSPEKQLDIDRAALSQGNSGFKNEKLGARVLAKWADRFFYSGIVVDELTSQNKCTVKFSDGNVHEISFADIVPVAKLKLGDQLMKIADGSKDELQLVSIIGVPSLKDSVAWHRGWFDVENEATNVTETVSWEKFVIDIGQRKQFVQK